MAGVGLVGTGSDQVNRDRKCYSIPDKYFGQKPQRFGKPQRFRTNGFFWITIEKAIPLEKFLEQLKVQGVF